MTCIREIITKKCQVILLEPNLVLNKIMEREVVDVEDVLELKQANIELTGGDFYAVLVESGMLAEITQAARELIASKEFQQKTIAKALLVNNIGLRLIGNFYLAVNRPHIKTRLFTDRASALSWLRSEISRSLKTD